MNTTLCLKPGLSLNITNTYIDQDVEVAYSYESSPLVFGFFLSGQGVNTLRTDSGRSLSFEGRGGDCGISYFPKVTGIYRYAQQTQLQVLHIAVEEEFLDVLMSGCERKIRTDFFPVIRRKTDNYHLREPLNGKLLTALQQLLSCPFEGVTRNLYLESKVLELLALQVDRLVFESASGSGSAACTRKDEDRLYAARDIVLRRYRNPPSLRELAHEVGLNEFKLKRGFQRLFGDTVFGCLYQHRMEQARQHLEVGDKSIKEVAYAVGYVSSSRFSDAFKRKFGMRPTEYRA